MWSLHTLSKFGASYAKLGWRFDFMRGGQWNNYLSTNTHPLAIKPLDTSTNMYLHVFVNFAIGPCWARSFRTQPDSPHPYPPPKKNVLIDYRFLSQI